MPLLPVPGGSMRGRKGRGVRVRIERDTLGALPVPAGAGTSQNMNLNEVIANRAIEILGGRRGDYSVIHPNDHVNMSQSTNDTFPSAMRLAILLALPGLRRALLGCEAELRLLARRFRRTVKTARTHLQDAVPITLGQEFGTASCRWVRAVF